MALLRQVVLLLGFLPALLIGLAACDECKESYTACDPTGASIRQVPIPGPDLGRLYLEMLYTVKDAPVDNNKANGLVRRQSPDGILCCAANTMCLLTRSFRIAMCWDKFTTNYFLPDGSFGSLSNGSYSTPAGDTANLISGEYELANGDSGNMYDDDPADRPETSQLPMPTPWTSSGVGSVILGSELGATGTNAASSSSIATSVHTTTTTTSSASSLTSSSLLAITTSSFSIEPPTTTTLTASTSTSNSLLAITTSSFTIQDTVTYYSVTASVSTGGGYGFSISNSSVVGPTATGTSGASMVTTFTSSPDVPFTGMAAASFFCYVAPGTLITAIAAMIVG